MGIIHIVVLVDIVQKEVAGRAVVPDFRSRVFTNRSKCNGRAASEVQSYQESASCLSPGARGVVNAFRG